MMKKAAQRHQQLSVGGTESGLGHLFVYLSIRPSSCKISQKRLKSHYVL